MKRWANNRAGEETKSLLNYNKSRISALISRTTDEQIRSKLCFILLKKRTLRGGSHLGVLLCKGWLLHCIYDSTGGGKRKFCKSISVLVSTYLGKYNETMSGRIDISKLKVPPEKHELETARFFAARGHDIEFIPPSNSPKMHTADIVMEGVPWEIKCPRGKSKRTIENNFRKANKQSENIIFDLRKINIPEATCLSQLKKEYEYRPHVKRLLIIKKNNELLTLSRK